MSERTKLRKVKKKDVTEKNMNKRLISRIQPQGGIKFKSGEVILKLETVMELLFMSMTTLMITLTVG